MRDRWPSSWGPEHSALFNFFSAYAVAADDAVEIYKGKAKVGAVPADVDFTLLRKALPLLIESYELGVRAGRASLAADFRALLDAAEIRDDAAPAGDRARSWITAPTR